MARPNEKPTGRSSRRVWVLYRRTIGQTTPTVAGRYTNYTEGWADCERFNRAFPRSVFTLVEEELNPKQRRAYEW